MTALVEEAVRAGAVGVGSTRLVGQKTRSGIPAPSQAATLEEYLAIARGLARAGRGALQIAPEFNQYPRADEELAMVIEVARQTGVPVTYSLKQTDAYPEAWRGMLEATEAANAEGLDIRPQVLGRPTGAIITWEANRHPFSGCPGYRALAALPLDERLRELGQPTVRAAIVAEAVSRPGGFERYYPRMFAVGDQIDYEPQPAASVVAVAERAGVPVAGIVYDALMADDGRGLLLLASGNYAQFSLEPALAMMRYRRSLLGLGDAGAHCTVICDASAPSYMLAYWARDRRLGARLELAEVVRKLTKDTADFYGFADRGRIEAGARADLNVIDHDRLTLGKPRMSYDLPAAGRRLVQPASGYVATLVDGVVVYEHDSYTGQTPGQLVAATG